MRTADSNVAAGSFVDVIRDIVKQDGETDDSLVLCQVASQDDAQHYSVRVLPDLEQVIHGLPNMTRYDLAVGDYCYVMRIGGSLNNAFICYAKGTNEDASLKWVQDMIDAAIAPLQLEINNFSSTVVIGDELPDAHGEPF